VTAAPPPLAADLNEGLKRLKLAAMRRLAPALLVTARARRWPPEEFLRTLVEAEITARDESHARIRMRRAAFPAIKTLEEFDVAASSIPKATFDYLASLEWIRGAENTCLIGPAGTGKSHMLVTLGVAAVGAGHKVRYFTAAELVETLRRAPSRQQRRPGHREPAPLRPDHLRPIRGSRPPVRNVGQRGLMACVRTSACRYPRSHTDVGMMTGHGDAACAA
jgi:DNA replication protein DnaC